MPLRPDLPTMICAFWLAALTRANPKPLTWSRAALARAVIVVWVNMHSLFALGYPR